MSEISDIFVGLSDALLETGIERVYAYDTIPSQFPALVFLRYDHDPDGAVGGTVFDSQLIMRLLVAHAVTEQAFLRAFEFASPSGPSSIRAAVNRDSTLNGNVAAGNITSINNLGRRALDNGAEYVGADVTFSFRAG